MAKILQIGNPILEETSKEVDFPLTKNDKELIKEMLKIVNSDPEKTAGLSAPQIGKAKRIIICRRVDKERGRNPKISWEVMINPVITEFSDKKSSFWEGCLSVKEGEIFGRVSRPDKIEFTYFDVNGEKKELSAKGYFSHVVQHEVDHLNGILFLKYIKDPSQLYTSDELDEMD